ncbi:ribokinase [Erysipelothrix urinaevulpis]|uniref:ribokinase n=1 Tax=Erysipelothrix urinaevulpis TaxID=2683717 RepID=UPI00135807DA|nr:ribokinase [Erysipelothrix urinaevulpis]
MKDILIVGSANIDYMIDCERFPLLGETVRGKDYSRQIGGKGLNQAIAAFKHQKNAHFCGAIGFDDDATMVVNMMDDLGMRTNYLFKDKSVSTGIAMVIRSNNDNAIVIHEGANGVISFEHIKQVIDRLDLAYVMFQFEIPLEVIKQTLTYCKEKGIKTVLNTAPAIPFDHDMYPLIDTIMLNQTESQFYTGIFPENEQEARRVGQVFVDCGVKHVVITLGEDGSYYMDSHQSLYQQAYPSDVVDTTGAGDAFAGVYVSALNEYGNVEKALQFASAAGSLTCENIGAAVSSPMRNKIELKTREEL